jgi:signal transduction histidine kinase
LEVHNEGPTIPAEDLGTLFDPFRRGAIPKVGKESGPGLGLGLFIVDQIIRAHDGTLSVRSGADGTTFVARMPRSLPITRAHGP